MENLIYLKFIGILFFFSFISGCGPSSVDKKEQEEASYSDGYNDGYLNGYKKALKCVDREGGDADDAAYYCERQM